MNPQKHVLRRVANQPIELLKGGGHKGIDQTMNKAKRDAIIRASTALYDCI